MPVRTTRIDRPLRLASPVIRPSRGPGPNAAPMYMPVATPHSETPTTISAIRQASGAPCGSIARDQFIASPIRTALLTVPSAGHWRNGTHKTKTAAPTRTTTVPIAKPRCSAMP